MTTEDVTFARIYVTEVDERKVDLLKRLHDEEQVRGVTAFRGISGFGPSGKVHEARLIDLAVNLPLVIEFFDTEENVTRILEHINSVIEPGHIVTWTAKLHK